jgi:hypothetical protein
VNSQKAIFVPGHGVPEAIRSIRFIPKFDLLGQVDSTSTSPRQDTVTIEVWQGDRCGEPTKEMLTTLSTSERMELTYSNGEMPVVSPDKSAVAVVSGFSSGWEVEFQSEFTDPQGNTVARTVTLDNYGTACETLRELKSLTRRQFAPDHRYSDVHRASDAAYSLGKFVGRLTTSISRVFKLAPNASKLSARRAISVNDADLNRPAVRTLSFVPESLDDSGP